MDNNRKTAYDALYEIETHDAYSNIAVNRSIKKIKPDDEAFVRLLVYGVLENRIYLQYKLSQLIKTGFEEQRPQIKVLLLLGAYQIEFVDKVPAYAAINECVNMAKKVCHGMQGFVNGVLRSYDRKSDTLKMPDKAEDIVNYLSVKYSYNRDICEMWIEEYGIERTQSLMIAGNMTPPLTIRVNTLKTSASELASLLKSEGFSVEQAFTGDEELDKRIDGMALNVKGSGLLKTSLYNEGFFSIQDISSMAAIASLSPKISDTIIDICAAPGGKSMCAAQMMENEGRIISCDIHSHKLNLMEDEAKRLGITINEFKVNDGKAENVEFAELADKVIVDAPCSGLGVIRRRPEIKLHVKRKNIEELSKIQLEILETSSKYVKKNGTLLYSTCTISKSENNAVTALFLKKNNFFLKEEEKQLFPDNDNSDGFYFCVFRRI